MKTWKIPIAVMLCIPIHLLYAFVVLMDQNSANLILDRYYGWVDE